MSDGISAIEPLGTHQVQRSWAAGALHEEPDACIAPFRVCGGAGWVTTGSTRQPTPNSLRSCLAAAAGAAHRQRSGAPFNGATDCSCKEPYMDNGMRTMQRASGGGNSWGPKPANKRAAPASHTRLTARVL